MTATRDEALAPADHVARTLRGDCTEFAMLGAAMCRAAGVPSRTAIGLVYHTDRLGTPKLSYHMWMEVKAEKRVNLIRVEEALNEEREAGQEWGEGIHQMGHCGRVGARDCLMPPV